MSVEYGANQSRKFCFEGKECHKKAALNSPWPICLPYDEPVAELEDLTHLRMTWPTPEYLFAMKCLVARSEEASVDRQNVGFLIRSLGLTTKQAVLEILERFYPADRIHIRTCYFVREIIVSMKCDSNLNR